MMMTMIKFVWNSILNSSHSPNIIVIGRVKFDSVQAPEKRPRGEKTVREKVWESEAIARNEEHTIFQ